jgi:gas vesicle protein
MKQPNWKMKTLLTGALIGMVTGLISAFLRIREAESRDTTYQIKTKDSALIGNAIFDFLRRIA